jgi:hypothetical protein
MRSSAVRRIAALGFGIMGLTILASERQAETWQVRSTPTAFLLDADGNVTAVIQLGSGDFPARIKRGLTHTS